MDREMNRWMDEHMEGFMVRGMDSQIYRWINGWKDEWSDR